MAQAGKPMCRRAIRRTSVLVGVAAALLLALPASLHAALCIYAGKPYSSGAIVCVQKSLMLTCRAEGSSPAWTVVADKDIADRCAVSTASFQRQYSLRVNYHPQGVPIGRGRCFDFAGRRYCE